MKRTALFAALVLAAACSKKSKTVSVSGGCDPQVKLPPGFCALVFADSAGPARDLVVTKSGDVFVAVLDQRRQAGGVLGLRDTDKDGHADAESRFGDAGTHGIAVIEADSTLLASTKDAVVRFRLADTLGVRKKIDTLVLGLAQRLPPSHTITIDTRGNLLVNIGAPSIDCGRKDPCPELGVAGGIWQFRLDRTNQEMKDGVRLATGLLDAVALAVNTRDTMVYAVTAGRDTARSADEMIRVASTRADYGWPYCTYDYLKQQRVLVEEYAYDKAGIDRCDRLIQPLVAYPPGWAPGAMVFYTGKMFPAQYQGGAFVTFQNRVIFQQFKEGLAADYTEFATGFVNRQPFGLAQGPDGALYLSDAKAGRIWKITYKKQ